MQKLTNEKARELLKELQYAKVQMGGQLSLRDKYFKQALGQLLEQEIVIGIVFEKVGEFYHDEGVGWYQISDEDPYGLTETFYRIKPEPPL